MSAVLSCPSWERWRKNGREEPCRWWRMDGSPSSQLLLCRPSSVGRNLFFFFFSFWLPVAMAPSSFALQNVFVLPSRTVSLSFRCPSCESVSVCPSWPRDQATLHCPVAMQHQLWSLVSFVRFVTRKRKIVEPGKTNELCNRAPIFVFYSFLTAIYGNLIPQSCLWRLLYDYYQRTNDPSVAIGSKHDPFARPTLKKGNEAVKSDQWWTRRLSLSCSFSISNLSPTASVSTPGRQKLIKTAIAV